MLKDIFGKEVNIGDMVLAHNVKHSFFTIKKRWFCLVVGDDLCFAIAQDYNDPKNDYLYIFKMDSCVLIDNLCDEEKKLKIKLIEKYKEY